MVSRRWHLLANDPVLWKAICDEQGWTWRRPTSMLREIERLRNPHLDEDEIPDEDEGMGGEEDEDAQHPYLAAGPSRLTQALPSYQVGSVSFSGVSLDPRKRQRLSAPSALASPSPAPLPDYKLLHQTHVRLRARVLRGAYELVVLQDRPRRSDPTTPDALGGHSATIYCLTLHTLPSGEQVLFTGSKDRTIREWDLARRRVRRVFQGGHGSSILSICAHGGFLASGGSDCVVAIWDLADGRLVTRKTDHMDSVLSVRFDDRRLVTCSKGGLPFFPPEMGRPDVFQIALCGHITGRALSPSTICTGTAPP
jgi:WD40 repeat protein